MKWLVFHYCFTLQREQHEQVRLQQGCIMTFRWPCRARQCLKLDKSGRHVCMESLLLYLCGCIFRPLKNERTSNKYSKHRVGVLEKRGKKTDNTSTSNTTETESEVHIRCVFPSPVVMPKVWETVVQFKDCCKVLWSVMFQRSYNVIGNRKIQFLGVRWRIWGFLYYELNSCPVLTLPV